MKYPLGIQTFSDLRDGGYVYIDKTELMYKMVNEGKYFFLGRPRRFGKSLFVSTLEAYFSGRYDLFENLAVSKEETKWEKYPILHLDFSGVNYTEPNKLKDVLKEFLDKWQQEYGCKTNSESPELRFSSIIECAYNKTGKGVVILVDEYDKPILDLYDNTKLEDDNRTLLKAFYGVMKKQDRYIHFAFLTGVTKLGKVSVFSDLNNITDISLRDDYCSICGITEKELHQTFDEEVETLADENDMTKDECYTELAQQYDGYHFSRKSVGVYNPYSLLMALQARFFNDFWYETGTPTYLIKILKEKGGTIPDLNEVLATFSSLGKIEVYKDDIISLLYQSGYLTIKEVLSRRLAKLGYPNMEVQRGFTEDLASLYMGISSKEASIYVEQFATDLKRGNVESFMERMKAFFDGGDYRIAGEKELYFQNVFHTVCRMLSLVGKAEEVTSNGRLDYVLQSANYVYIVEFKYDGSAAEALQQINDKGYANPFKKDSRKLFKIGVNFSSETRSISDWVIE